MRPPILDRARLAPKVTEAHLSRQVQDFLKLDQWRVFRMEPLSNVIQGRYSAELGCPDLLCLRYAHPVKGWANSILWIEVKREGAKPKKHQAEWHASERARGGEVWVVSDFEAFKLVYINSGLNRNMHS